MDGPAAGQLSAGLFILIDELASVRDLLGREGRSAAEAHFSCHWSLSPSVGAFVDQASA